MANKNYLLSLSLSFLFFRKYRDLSGVSSMSTVICLNVCCFFEDTIRTVKIRVGAWREEMMCHLAEDCVDKKWFCNVIRIRVIVPALFV